MYPSEALAYCSNIFVVLVVAIAPVLVPLLVVTWVIRLTAELIRGGR